MSTGEAAPLLVGQVVGENVKRIRERYGLTQAELARKVQGVGLRWGRSHIAALESGNRESVDVSTLVLLAEAIDCKVAELLHGEGEVRLAAEALSTREGLRLALAGTHRPGLRLEGLAGARQAEAARRDRVTPSGPIDPATGLAPWYDIAPVQADVELADRLGVRPEEVTSVAESLWGRTLHQERDRRLAEMPAGMTAGERRARRGHITRALAKEVEAVITERREGQ